MYVEVHVMKHDHSNTPLQVSLRLGNALLRDGEHSLSFRQARGVVNLAHSVVPASFAQR